MKRAFFAFLLVLPGVGAFSQSGTFTLNGSIAGKNAGYLYLTYTDKDNKPVVDSALIKDGRFSFTGSVSEPTNAIIKPSRKPMSVDDPNITTFFIEPAVMDLNLTYNKFSEFVLTGSQTQDDMARVTKLKAEINAELKPYIDAYNAANDEYIKAKQEKKPDEEQKVLYDKATEAREKFNPYQARLNKIDYAFIKENPDSHIAAYLLFFKTSRLSLDSLQFYYNNLSARVRSVGFGKRIAEEITKLKKGMPGAVAANFSVPDINGKQFSLADHKGKFVLIDFWASWCGPCREGNPHLKQLYAKYKDKGLEIVGVSDDDSAVDAWKKAVQQDDIGSWRHVLRGLKRTADGYDRTNDISENYGIHTLPTKILVDRNGLIIGRYGGGGESDEAMDKKLAEIMK